jgi:lipoprotein-releasing system permease protein
MYKLTLILKYLHRKLGPMFASLAVMLCTAMVIIVISVMGGFLDLLQTSARQLTGDVSVLARSMTGFAYYEELADQIEALPEVAAVSPVVTTFGMINLYGQTLGVNIMGIEPTGFSKIVRYEDTLMWSAEDVYGRYGLEPGVADKPMRGADLHAQAMTLKPAAIDIPGVVIGVEVNPWHYRDEQGQYDFSNSAVQQEAAITALPLTERGAPAEIGPSYLKVAVLNEFKSGLYDIDKSQVFVRFDVLQTLLGMDRQENPSFDPETGEEIPGATSSRPARTSEIVIKGAEGYTLDQVYRAIQVTVAGFAKAHPNTTAPAVRTWEQRHAQFINAVKNEKGMVTFLFIIISIVAVVMVATTFYMTVLEKTRDIGVLRAVGASQAGIMSLFLGYGLAVGLVGSALGLALAVSVVWNLNEIQYWLANHLGVSAHYAWCAGGGALIGAVIGGSAGYAKRKALRFALLGAATLTLLGLIGAWVSLDQVDDLAYKLNHAISFKMWDPQTYFFDRIPDKVKFYDALFIVLGAILSSVIGALIPAVLAARLDPVEALRYE